MVIFLGSSVVAFLGLILHVYINQYAGEYGFFDLGFCLFVCVAIYVMIQESSLRHRFLNGALVALVFGLCYDLFSVNEFGLSMLSFLMTTCLLMGMMDSLERAGWIARWVAFTVVALFFQLMSLIILVSGTELTFSVFRWSLLWNTALLNGTCLCVLAPVGVRR